MYAFRAHRAGRGRVLPTTSPLHSLDVCPIPRGTLPPEIISSNSISTRTHLQCLYVIEMR
jgi:hypothetical protein